MVHDSYYITETKQNFELEVKNLKYVYYDGSIVWVNS
jgi:hypothetical protein